MLRIIYATATLLGIPTSMTDVVLGSPQLMDTTFYADRLQGKLTANHTPYNPNDLMAAAADWPFGTQLLVTYGFRSVIVTVQDRPDHKTQLDLSRRAFKELAPLSLGRIQTTVRVVCYPR